MGGCGCTETADHLFLGCTTFGSTWLFLWRWLDIDFVSSRAIGDHFYRFIHLADMPCSSHLFFKLIWLACVWAIRKERNNRILKNVTSDPIAIAGKVKLNSFLWLKTNHPSFVFCYNKWCRHPLLCMGVSI